MKKLLLACSLALLFASPASSQIIYPGGGGTGGGGGGPSPGNPTATAGDTAVNGTANTYQRSDSAPAVQKATSTQFGIIEPDNTTITCASGVCSATTSGTGNANLSPATGNTAGDAVVMSNTTTTVTDAGFAPAQATVQLSKSTSFTVTAAQFKGQNPVLATATLTETFPATSTLNSGGFQLLQNSGNNTITIQPNAADQVCVGGVASCGTAGASLALTAGYSAVIQTDAAGHLYVSPIAPAGSSSGLTVGSTTISGGNTGRIEYNNTGVLGELPLGTGVATALSNAVSGSGSICLSVSSACSGGGGGLSVIPNYITGGILSNDGTTPASVIDISPITAADSTNTAWIIAGSFTKSTAGAWASGSGSNGMGNGLTIASNTWYYVCLANNGGTPDDWFDTSSSCANRPSGISDTKYRVIGFFHTCWSSNGGAAGPCSSASTSIVGFKQTTIAGGVRTYWSPGLSENLPVDANNLALTANTQSLVTLSVPPGFKVTAYIHVSQATACVSVKVSDPLEPTNVNITNQAQPSNSTNMGDLSSASLQYQRSSYFVATNTSSQIGITPNTTCTTANGVQTNGWDWDRGMNGS